jgi:hypothetical protein
VSAFVIEPVVWEPFPACGIGALGFLGIDDTNGTAPRDVE